MEALNLVAMLASRIGRASIKTRRLEALNLVRMLARKIE